MPETERIMFELREIAEILVKERSIKSGFWGIGIEFGLAATNIPSTPDGKTLTPAGLTLVQKIGIQQFKEPNNLTVDAAEVNKPKRKITVKRAKK